MGGGSKLGLGSKILLPPQMMGRCGPGGTRASGRPRHSGSRRRRRRPRDRLRRIGSSSTSSSSDPDDEEDEDEDEQSSLLVDGTPYDSSLAIERSDSVGKRSATRSVARKFSDRTGRMAGRGAFHQRRPSIDVYCRLH